MNTENKIELSIILPCRNEQDALPYCLEQIQKVIIENNLNAEIIVSDSSADRSPEIAIKYGTVLVKHDKDGYGNAYREAFEKVQGEHLFMADADASYDFFEIPVFLRELKSGADMVVGNRFAGKIDKGAMPWSHRYIGNPLLSFLLRLFFGSKVKDVHCGMRAISRQALNQLNFHTTGMEFASEMVIEAVRNKLNIKQLPINYHCRIGSSKLRSVSDGWRHLRFMLLYSPLFLFFIPGALLLSMGTIGVAYFYFEPPVFNFVNFDYHPMFLAVLLVIAGYQFVLFSIFAKTYAMTHLDIESKLMQAIHRHLTIEKGAGLGLGLCLIGILYFIHLFYIWLNSGLGELNEAKNAIVATTVIIVGLQTFFSVFMLSILGIKKK